MFSYVPLFKSKLCVQMGENPRIVKMGLASAADGVDTQVANVKKKAGGRLWNILGMLEISRCFWSLKQLRWFGFCSTCSMFWSNVCVVKHACIMLDS